MLTDRFNGAFDETIQKLPKTDDRTKTIDASNLALTEISHSNITGSITGQDGGTIALTFSFKDISSVPEEGYVNFSFALIMTNPQIVIGEERLNLRARLELSQGPSFDTSMEDLRYVADHGGYSCLDCEFEYDPPWTYPLGHHPLPIATGGELPLTFTLSPTVPGLRLTRFYGTNSERRRWITGAPTSVGTYAVTYRVEDASGRYEELHFSIRVGDPYPNGGYTATIDVQEPDKYYEESVLISGIDVPLVLFIGYGGPPFPVEQYSVNGGVYRDIEDEYSRFVENGDLITFRVKAEKRQRPGDDCYFVTGGPSEVTVSTMFPPEFLSHAQKAVKIFDLNIVSSVKGPCE